MRTVLGCDLLCSGDFEMYVQISAMTYDSVITKLCFVLQYAVNEEESL